MTAIKRHLLPTTPPILKRSSNTFREVFDVCPADVGLVFVIDCMAIVQQVDEFQGSES